MCAVRPVRALAPSHRAAGARPRPAGEGRRAGEAVRAARGLGSRPQLRRRPAGALGSAEPGEDFPDSPAGAAETPYSIKADSHLGPARTSLRRGR